jgi:hypothetical protein
MHRPEVGTLDALQASMESRCASADLFEQLWLLRRCYDLPSDHDRRCTLTIDEAIGYGEQLLYWIRAREPWRDRGLHRTA